MQKTTPETYMFFTTIYRNQESPTSWSFMSRSLNYGLSGCVSSYLLDGVAEATNRICSKLIEGQTPLERDVWELREAIGYRPGDHVWINLPIGGGGEERDISELFIGMNCVVTTHQ